MLVLDLSSVESPQWLPTESYYGKPYVWNMIHNFGGKDLMFGDPEGFDNVRICLTAQIPTLLINSQAFRMMQTSSNSTSWGVGLMMEGIFQNYIIYQYALDRYWITKNTPIPTQRQWCGCQKLSSNPPHSPAQALQLRERAQRPHRRRD